MFKHRSVNTMVQVSFVEDFFNPDTAMRNVKQFHSDVKFTFVHDDDVDEIVDLPSLKKSNNPRSKKNLKEKPSKPTSNGVAFVKALKRPLAIKDQNTPKSVILDLKDHLNQKIVQAGRNKVVPGDPMKNRIIVGSVMVNENLDDFDIKSLKAHDENDELQRRLKDESPECNCFADKSTEPDTGAYYVHLGHARTLFHLRQLMEKRCGVSGNALRIEKARYCPEEGKSSLGCPIAKYVIRRQSEEEKVVIVAKERIGHSCEYAWMVAGILLWDGVSKETADKTYQNMSDILANDCKPIERQCDSNKKKTCACQGLDNESSGASFVFGCSWSMYHDGCKFGGGHNADITRKFKLTSKNLQREKVADDNIQHLATVLGKKLSFVAPDAFHNMTAFEEEGHHCRIGHNPGRPFAGVAAVSDFCAHAHKDVNNMISGCTVILTLTKPENRIIGKKPEDEQLHVLPHYMVDDTDEYGSVEGQKRKVSQGKLEVLQQFERNLISHKDRKKRGGARGHPQGFRKKFLDNFHKASKMTDNLEAAVRTAALSATKEDMARPPKRSKRSDPIPQLDGASDLAGIAQKNPNFKAVASKKAELNIENSACIENFGDRNVDVGGLAFALTHGSVLIECAKQELHATTALKKPNRFHPTRIGMVFYQHRNLMFPNHGFSRYLQKCKDKNARDYEAWKLGTFVPTKHKLKMMKKDGFRFPANVETVATNAIIDPKTIKKPDLAFLDLPPEQDDLSEDSDFES